MTVKEFLAQTKTSGLLEYGPRPRVELGDGISLSVQAGPGYYCEGVQGNYSSVEIGYPSAEISELMPYAEDASDPTETVYGHVPIELLEEIVKARGGLTIIEKIS